MAWSSLTAKLRFYSCSKINLWWSIGRTLLLTPLKTRRNPFIRIVFCSNLRAHPYLLHFASQFEEICLIYLALLSVSFYVIVLVPCLFHDRPMVTTSMNRNRKYFTPALIVSTYTFHYIPLHFDFLFYSSIEFMHLLFSFIPLQLLLFSQSQMYKTMYLLPAHT
jgi:hypothetical protein